MLTRLRSAVLDAGVTLRRGHKVTHPDPSVLVPGLVNTRFAPLDGIAHAYLATTTFAALLESALHEATPPEAPADVIVLWSPPAMPSLLKSNTGGLGSLSSGPGWDYLADLAALLAITVP